MKLEISTTYQGKETFEIVEGEEAINKRIKQKPWTHMSLESLMAGMFVYFRNEGYFSNNPEKHKDPSLERWVIIQE